MLVRPARLERGTVMGLSSVTLFLIKTNSVFVGTVARGPILSSLPQPPVWVRASKMTWILVDLFVIPSDISLL